MVQYVHASVRRCLRVSLQFKPLIATKHVNLVTVPRAWTDITARLREQLNIAKPVATAIEREPRIDFTRRCAQRQSMQCLRRQTIQAA